MVCAVMILREGVTSRFAMPPRIISGDTAESGYLRVGCPLADLPPFAAKYFVVSALVSVGF